MKDNLNIEELFKEKFSSFEGDVSSNAWTNIQQGMNAANITTGVAAAKTGMSLFMKAAIFTGGIVVATVGGVYLFSDNDTNIPEEQNLVQNNPVIVTDNSSNNTIETEGINIPAEEVGIANEMNSEVDVVRPNIEEGNVTELDGIEGIHNSVSSDETTEENTIDENEAVSDEDNSEKGNTVVQEDEIDSEIVDQEDEASEDETELDIDYPTGKMSFSADNQFAPSTYDFESNAKNFSTVRWDFGDGTIGEGENVRHTYEKPGSFTVRLTILGEGEVYEESQTIVIKAKSGIDNISNVITPNGDRINDFFIVNSHEIETFYIVIKDQKGTIVFETKDPNFKWYGVDLGGNSLDVGMYLYYIYAKGTDGSEFKIPGEISIE